MAKSKNSPPSRKGAKATEAQKAALARGRAQRDANKAYRASMKAEGINPRRARLEALKSGELSVRDLDNSEITRGQVHDGNGSFIGGPIRMPVRIQDEMFAENVRRTRAVFNKYGRRAAKRMVELMEDSEADPTQLRAAMAIVERHIGKTPDVVHVGSETEFDRLQQGVFEYVRDEDSVTGGDESGDEDEEG